VSGNISKSKVLCYKQCPLKYKFCHIDKIPKPKPKAMERGIKVHEFMEDVFDKKFEECKNYDLILKEKLVDNINNFVSKIEEKPIMQEVKLLDDENKITGILDVVFTENGKTILLDYKTGKYKPLFEFEYELALYVHLLEKTKNIKADYWGIFFIDAGEVLIGKVDKNAVENAVVETKEIAELIKKGVFNKKENMFCNWCEYQEECKNEKDCSSSRA
jgi:CRISPR/Cas system-associated exonuclease Cas4 (RecB family)